MLLIEKKSSMALTLIDELTCRSAAKQTAPLAERCKSFYKLNAVHLLHDVENTGSLKKDMRLRFSSPGDFDVQQPN